VSWCFVLRRLTISTPFFGEVRRHWAKLIAEPPDAFPRLGADGDDQLRL
jgi:hypothetical protein